MHWALLKGAGSSDRDVEIAAPCSASSRLQRGGLTNENPQAALFIRELTDGLEQAANVWRTQSGHGIPPLRTAGKITHTHRRPAMIAQRRATRIRRRAHRRQREACAEADLMSVMRRRGVSAHNKTDTASGQGAVRTGDASKPSQLEQLHVCPSHALPNGHLLSPCVTSKKHAGLVAARW